MKINKIILLLLLNPLSVKSMHRSDLLDFNSIIPHAPEEQIRESLKDFLKSPNTDLDSLLPNTYLAVGQAPLYALHLACCFDSMNDLIQIMLAKSKQPQLLEDEIGRRALAYCAKRNSTPENAKLLLAYAKERNFNLAKMLAPIDNETFLDIALRTNKIEFCDLFLQHGITEYKFENLICFKAEVLSLDYPAQLKAMLLLLFRYRILDVTSFSAIDDCLKKMSYYTLPTMLVSILKSMESFEAFVRYISIAQIEHSNPKSFFRRIPVEIITLLQEYQMHCSFLKGATIHPGNWSIMKTHVKAQKKVKKDKCIVS